MPAWQRRKIVDRMGKGKSKRSAGVLEMSVVVFGWSRGRRRAREGERLRERERDADAEREANWAPVLAPQWSQCGRRPVGTSRLLDGLPASAETWMPPYDGVRRQ